MGFTKIMTLAIFASSCHVGNNTVFTTRAQLPKISKCHSIFLTSIHAKNNLKIRSEKKENDFSRPRNNQKQNSRTPTGSLGFAMLDALKTKKPPKNKVQKPQRNDTQLAKNNEEKIIRIAPKIQTNDTKTAKKNEENITRIAEKFQTNGTQTAQKNEVKISRVSLKQRNPSPEVYDPELNSNGDMHLNSRGKVKSSLSGEDILLALQNASMDKAKEEGRRNRKSIQKAASRRDSTRGSEDIPRVLGEVRSITVKPEWVARTESLEKRLKELKERAGFV